MLLYPNPAAHIGYGAPAAMGRYGTAHHLTKGHEHFIIIQPKFAGQLFAQSKLRFLGRFRFHISEPVADAMNVGIHTDGFLCEAFDQNQIRRLSSHTGKREKGIDVIGHISPMLFNDFLADLKDLLRLRWIKTYWIDEIS